MAEADVIDLMSDEEGSDMENKEKLVMEANGGSTGKVKHRDSDEDKKEEELAPPPASRQKTEPMDADALLKELRNGVDQRTVGVLPVQYRPGMRRQMCDWSVLHKKLQEVGEVDWASIIQTKASQDASLDRALGCLIGMVAGDSVGAPLEFTPASSTLLEERQEEDYQSYVQFDSASGALHYKHEKNAFRLNRGQWTDDASMGLCMAESMLVRGAYHGGDVRVRFHLWWNFGYCNAFRHDPKRPGSVGLGGNIGQSLRDLVDGYTGKSAEQVPGRYEATGEDAGNGSLMRLAPVPIRYHKDVEKAMEMAEESSYATHPGPDAANCCRFVAFFVCRALHRTDQDDVDIQTFTQQTIEEFLAREEGTPQNNNPLLKLQALLHSKPPSPKEACWNWKAERCAVEETLQNRGRNYNGYPVSAEYFGSYCMDGLAMALWAVSHSNSMADCILKTVNLRGDSDTTASIAGQLAGAFYGYSSLVEDPCGKRMVQDIRQWDPLYEMELRALLLHRDGAKKETKE